MAIPFLDDYVGALQSQGNLFDTYKYLVEKGADALIPYGGQGIQAIADMFKNKPAVGDRENYVTPDNLAKFYAGENYGYQSPESYKSVFGGFPRGFTPPVSRPSLNAPRTDTEEPFIAMGTAKNPGDLNTPYYTGKDYGYQSPESYKKVLGAYPVGYTPRNSINTTNVTAPTTDPKKGTNISRETSNPVIDVLAATKEGQLLGLEEKARSFERQKQMYELYARSAMDKSRENTNRQEELKRLEVWRDVTAAHIEAAVRGQSLLATTMIALQTPNVNVMDALSKAYLAGGQAFASGASPRFRSA